MARLRTHPGEVLREEYLVPLGMSARALAKSLGVPANRITEIMRGERDVSADTAIRLGRYFRTDPRFWLNLHPPIISRKRKARTTIPRSGPRPPRKASAEHFLIDRILLVRRAVEHAEDVLHGRDRHAVHRLDGHARHMSGYDRVRQLEQRIVGRCGLGIKYVDTG